MQAPIDPKKDEEQYDLRFPPKGYMDQFINPPAVLERRGQGAAAETAAKGRQSLLPAEPERDVLLFLSNTRRSKHWQRDVLSIVRDEAYYFAPQGQTKIMNEGWASYWHSTIMTRHGLTDAEVDRLCRPPLRHDGHARDRLNPYKLGIELFRDIEERWNNGPIRQGIR